MASAVVQKAKIVGTAIVRGFDLVKGVGQARLYRLFQWQALLPMKNTHAHKAGLIYFTKI